MIRVVYQGEIMVNLKHAQVPSSAHYQVHDDVVTWKWFPVSLVDTAHMVAVMGSIEGFIVVNLNKLLNKQLNCCDSVMLMWYPCNDQLTTSAGQFCEREFNNLFNI